MKCTFYRPECIDLKEWNTIINKLRADLDELDAGNLPEREVICYLADLLSQAEPLERRPEMYFFGFDKPEHMPSDARVDYFYWPTYVAAALIMKACLLYPGILEKISFPDGKSAERIYRAVLLGCTGRGFRGHGYDDIRGLIEAMELFVDHGAVELFVDHGTMDFQGYDEDICPEFTACLNEALSFLLTGLLNGKVAGAWSDDYTERAYEILVKARMLMPEQDESEQDESGQNESGQDTTSQGKSGREPEERLYLAYGSNLNIQQMMYRCPDARIVGTAELPGWRLMYKGSMSGNYLTIERAKGYSVPVAVWAVSRKDKENLDYYEGFPAFYYKKRIGVTLRETYSGKTALPRLLSISCMRNVSWGVRQTVMYVAAKKATKHLDSIRQSWMRHISIAAGVKMLIWRLPYSVFLVHRTPIN